MKFKPVLQEFCRTKEEHQTNRHEHRRVLTFFPGRTAACVWKSARRLLRCGNDNLCHREIYLSQMLSHHK